MIGQIACQSNSLHMVNSQFWVYILQFFAILWIVGVTSHNFLNKNNNKKIKGNCDFLFWVIKLPKTLDNNKHVKLISFAYYLAILWLKQKFIYIYIYILKNNICKNVKVLHAVKISLLTLGHCYAIAKWLKGHCYAPSFHDILVPGFKCLSLSKYDKSNKLERVSI